MKKTIMIPNNTAYTKELINKLREQNIKVKGLKSFHYSTPYNFLIILLYKYFGYKNIHLNWSYIFAFSFIQKMFFYIAKKLGYNIVFTVHNVVPHKARTIDFKLTEKILNESDKVLIHCKKTIHDINEVYNIDVSDKAVEVFHPLFNQYENDKKSIPKDKAKKVFLNIDKNKKVLLFFGKVKKYKGVPLFIELIKKLGDDYIGVIAGRPDNSYWVKKLVGKQANIKYSLYTIPDNLLQFYFNSCDVVVLPYYNITTSGVLLTAYYFEKPVIISKLGCIDKYVVEGKTGYTFKSHDLNNLYNKTIKLFNSDYETMGLFAKDFADKNFSWGKLVEVIKKQYR